MALRSRADASTWDGLRSHAAMEEVAGGRAPLQLKSVQRMPMLRNLLKTMTEMR